MPIIYLSPSTQENNSFVTGGTEEQYMNLLADKLVPYLDASGIRYVRNTPEMTAASSIAASNAGRYDLHLALHSNAAQPGRYGSARGSLAFYYPHRRRTEGHLSPAQSGAGPAHHRHRGGAAGPGPLRLFGAGLPRQYL